MSPKTREFRAEILKQHLDLSRLAQVLVAYSGGLDSHVLLHSLASLRDLHPQLEIRAMHIDHGLSAMAQNWAQHCEEVCRALGVALQVQSVNVKQHLDSCSLEEAARNLRYEAFAHELQPGECLMVAHTEDDQAETLLLQLLRGSGVKGLAAMPHLKRFAAGSLMRPLLHTSRGALQHYAKRQELVWIEDESNAITTLDRNYLRHKILPLLMLRWPGTKKVLSRVARHCAEASVLTEALACQDLVGMAGRVAHTLSVSALVKLAPIRQKNVLRFWLRSLHLRVPNTRRLTQLQQDFLYSPPDAAPKMVWSGVEVRRFGGDLYAMPPLPAHDTAAIFPWDIEQSLMLPGVGLLTAKRAANGLEVLAGTKITVRFRQGGERLHPVGRCGSHSLKKLLQEWRIPPWQRDRIPLIYSNEELVAVANYAIAKKYAPTGHRRGLVILVEFNPGV